MSFCTSPIVPAISAVSAPMTATIIIVSGAWLKSTALRPIMYTPAVTIVAAWMSADTGVGPSMASGSQMYSGICADLPVAPTKSRSVASDRMPNAGFGRHRPPRGRELWKSSVPNCVNRGSIPSMNA